MTNNFSLQISYTYSDCIDISSGFWGQEGGQSIQNPYNLFGDRGPCSFMIRHNVSTNGLYLIPFKRNRLVSGWQLGAISYFSTGGDFNFTGLANLGKDNGGNGQRAEYVGGAPGCNNQPVNANLVSTAKGLFYLNPACFTVAPVGEPANLGRNALWGPNSASFNPSFQKNTQIAERFNLQFRAEIFNAFNRNNFSAPILGFTQGSTASAATVGTGAPTPTFGQITSTYSTGRQIQFGLKLIF